MELTIEELRARKARCSNCEYFRQIGKTEYGGCHFDPPMMYYDELSYTRRSAWPEVHKNESCGKFEGIKKE